MTKTAGSLWSSTFRLFLHADTGLGHDVTEPRLLPLLFLSNGLFSDMDTLDVWMYVGTENEG